MTFLECLWQELALILCKRECLTLLCKRKPEWVFVRRYLYEQLVAYAQHNGGNNLQTWMLIRDLLSDPATDVSLNLEQGLTLDRPAPSEYFSFVVSLPTGYTSFELPFPWKSHLVSTSTCRYYSHNSYLKCAVNPSADCDECPHFEPKSHE